MAKYKLKFKHKEDKEFLFDMIETYPEYFNDFKYKVIKEGNKSITFKADNAITVVSIVGAAERNALNISDGWCFGKYKENYDVKKKKKNKNKDKEKE